MTRLFLGRPRRWPARSSDARHLSTGGCLWQAGGHKWHTDARTRRGGRARFKAHAWRACKLERVSGVQIPPSPPSSLYLHVLSNGINEEARLCGPISRLAVPEIAIESLCLVEKCALFSVQKWRGALSILISNTLARPFIRQANLWRCVRHLSSDPCRAKNDLAAASRTGFSLGRERCV